MTDKELFSRLSLAEEEMFFLIQKLRDRIVELSETEQKHKELCK